MKQELSDKGYMHAARLAEELSTCNKKKIGCVLVLTRGKQGMLQGANGPPHPLGRCNLCPRLNVKSGTCLDKCRAVHAERDVLLKAAKFGFCTKDSILYSPSGVPCSQCLLELIAAGMVELVCGRETYYDELSKSILAEWRSKGGKFRIFSGSD
jgi:deoxycytidylate deaminase